MKKMLNLKKPIKPLVKLLESWAWLIKKLVVYKHTLRYWESQFKQIKPLVRAGNRRYYSKKNLLIIKLIKFLLRDKGMTINGVKKILDNQKVHSLDDNINLGIYKPNQQSRKIIKDKVKNISKIITELKLFK